MRVVHEKRDKKYNKNGPKIIDYDTRHERWGAWSERLAFHAWVFMVCQLGVKVPFKA